MVATPASTAVPYPFAPGPLAVRERSVDLRDARRDRDLRVDVWSPASDGRSPLILYSHSSGGHRRQSASLCRHLATHGYVVAAADHTGNTRADVASRAASGQRLGPDEIDAYVARIVADRVPDLRFVLDELLHDAIPELTTRIDPQRIGLLGYSFGGWAVLATPEHDDRVRAIVAMAPAGNSKPLPGIIPATLTFRWKSDVATLFLVADHDRFTPLDGARELLERAPEPKRMFVLKDADHGHFAEEITDPGCSAESAHAFSCGLALAHFDARLKRSAEAARFLDVDPIRALHENGIEAGLP